MTSEFKVRQKEGLTIFIESQDPLGTPRKYMVEEELEKYGNYKILRIRSTYLHYFEGAHVYTTNLPWKIYSRKSSNIFQRIFGKPILSKDLVNNYLSIYHYQKENLEFCKTGDNDYFDMYSNLHNAEMKNLWRQMNWIEKLYVKIYKK